MADKPDAIITGSDEIAAGIIAEAKGNGWRVPDDLAVVGFDNQPTAVLLEPQLTTIHQPTLEMGRAAMAQMLAAVKKEPGLEQVLYLPAPLLVREST
ncbi:substrate-binding domain-containing protein [Bacillus sp. JCM 19041]|uniref:substrate-binding domain-containing protein n=1 Tax=Bacillus sp. JCM 19041 TaxID=1460637 RepID=UPI003369F0D5